MRIHKTSILLIDTHGKNSDVVQVPTHLLKCWKRYLLGLTTVALGLIFLSGFLAYRITSEGYQEKLAEALGVKNAINLAEAKRTFHSIDEGIYRINSFLAKRGLTNMQMDNVGGGSDFDITDINQLAGFYYSQLAEIESVIQYVPLDVPHYEQIISHFASRRNPFTRNGIENHIGTGVDFLRTLYAHLPTGKVVIGQKVSIGEFIGRFGNTGRSPPPPPHLHYEIFASGGRRINPFYFFDIIDDS